MLKNLIFGAAAVVLTAGLSGPASAAAPMAPKVVTSALRENLSINLRTHRTKLGITQEKLSELSELHQTYISDVERGLRNVTLDVVERLAAGLSMPSINLLLPPDQTAREMYRPPKRTRGR